MDSSSDSPDFTIRLILLALFLPVLLLAICGLLYVRGITQLRRDLSYIRTFCRRSSPRSSQDDISLATFTVISTPVYGSSILTPLPIALVHTPPSSTEDFSIIPPGLYIPPEPQTQPPTPPAIEITDDMWFDANVIDPYYHYSESAFTSTSDLISQDPFRLSDLSLTTLTSAFPVPPPTALLPPINCHPNIPEVIVRGPTPPPIAGPSRIVPTISQSSQSQGSEHSLQVPPRVTHAKRRLRN
jgi:hypothetical protein